MSIKIAVNGYEYSIDTFNFPGGEVSVNILKSKGLRKQPCIANITIEAKIRNSNDIMELLLVKDAVDRWAGTRDHKTRLLIPYMPYARQDRVCNRGEAHSLKVMCDLINNMNFDLVTVVDPHSIVTESLLNNCEIINQVDIITTNFKLGNKLIADALTADQMRTIHKYIIVSPDAGAEKKAMKVAQHFGCDMIRATKRRDLATGKIQEIGFIDPIPRGHSFLIVDDICDGGGTFLPLASELHEAGADKVELYVTHGIFSKGTQILLDSFDTIYTTDSFYEEESTDNIKVIKL